MEESLIMISTLTIPETVRLVGEIRISVGGSVETSILPSDV